MEQNRVNRRSYPSDVSDAQWQEIRLLFIGTRQCKWEKRELLNAVFYVVKTGCQWRHLPHDFPPYQTVYSFYRRTLKSGLWDKILQYLVVKTRENAGRTAQPSYGLVDSQSVKTVAGSEERGIDGGKKRKVASGIL